MVTWFIPEDKLEYSSCNLLNSHFGSLQKLFSTNLSLLAGETFHLKTYTQCLSLSDSQYLHVRVSHLPHGLGAIVTDQPGTNQAYICPKLYSWKGSGLKIKSHTSRDGGACQDVVEAKRN